MVSLLPLCLLASQFAPDGGVAVVTTDGLWLVRTSSAQVDLLADAAALGLPAGLLEPTVSWVPDSDSLLVTSRAPSGGSDPASLFRVDIGSGSSVDIVDLTPSVAVTPAPDWIDVDVSRGLDTAFLLDSLGRVFSLADPAHADGASLGFFGDAQIVQPRSIAVDAARWPLGAVVLGRFESRRLQASGVSELLLSAATHGQWNDTDANPVTAEVYYAHAESDEFGKVGDGLVLSGNAWGFCAKPVKAPADIDWDAGKNKYVVLAGEGVDCLFGGAAQGWPNHVVRMPFAQIIGPGPIPPGAEPALLTPPGDTGISGGDGDLALIRHVAPDTTFFGAPGVSAAGSLPRFDNAGYQGGFRPGKTVFVALKHAPPQAEALLVLGFGFVGQPFQQQLLYPSLELLVPAASDAEGRALISFKLPAVPGLAGQKVFMQWWIDDVTSGVPGDLVGSHGAIAVIDD